MVHNLLQVCLLTITMGVGAKASTPINLNRQERQTQNENDPYRFETEANVQGVSFDTFYGNIGTTNYNVTNWGWGQRLQTTNQLEISNILYTTAGPLHFDPNQQNDVFGYRKQDLHSNNSWTDNTYEKAEILSITPRTTVYNTKVTKNIYTQLITNENITANLTLKIRVYYSTTGSLDEFKTYYTGNDANGRVRTIVHKLQEDIPASSYDYYEESTNLVVDQNTPTTERGAQYTFDLPLIKDVNTVAVFIYEIYCTNDDVDPTGMLFDQPSLVNNGIYTQGIKTSETILTGKWSTAEVTQEVIDLPRLMWEILSMPFAFISTAFNLTLFPGTPYSINFTNLFMVIILVLIVLFVVKKLKP